MPNRSVNQLGVSSPLRKAMKAAGIRP